MELNRHESALLDMARVWFNGCEVRADELLTYLSGWVQDGLYCGHPVSLSVIVSAY